MRQIILCALCASIALITSGASVRAQRQRQQGAGDPQRAQASAARTTADEVFELNINERRITEKDYEASTSVAVGDEGARGLNLRVGVAVGATAIDVLLRNVRGRVRFRASLDQIVQIINEHRAGQPPAADATAP